MHSRKVVAGSLLLTAMLGLFGCASAADEDAAIESEAITAKPGARYSRALKACLDSLNAQADTRSAPAQLDYAKCLTRATTNTVAAIERNLSAAEEARAHRGKTAATLTAVRRAWKDACGILPAAINESDSRIPAGLGRISPADMARVKSGISARCTADAEVFIAREIGNIVDLGADVNTASVLPPSPSGYGADCQAAYDASAATAASTLAINETNETFRTCMMGVAKSIQNDIRAHTDATTANGWITKVDAVDRQSADLCTLLVHAGFNVGGTLSSNEASGCTAAGAKALAQTAEWGADSPRVGSL
jgi:hypothetical protein